MGTVGEPLGQGQLAGAVPVQRPVATLARVVTALVLRESKTRFGRSRFGYVWALVEPMAYVGIFLAIRTAVGRSPVFGESVILFVMTGLLATRLFIAIASRLTASISSNRALLAYPPVKPNDVIFARFILETVTMLIVVLVFFAGLQLAARYEVVISFSAFTAALAATVFLALGVGMFNAVVSVLYPLWGRLFGLMRLPIFLLSGIFYVPKQMPVNAQAVLEWNPVLHCVEWLRTASYLSYDPLLDRGYVMWFAATAFTLGFALERAYRYRLLAG